MRTPWDARTCDRPNAPQQAWAVEVLTRLADIAPNVTVLDDPIVFNTSGEPFVWTKTPTEILAQAEPSKGTLFTGH